MHGQVQRASSRFYGIFVSQTTEAQTGKKNNFTPPKSHSLGQIFPFHPDTCHMSSSSSRDEEQEARKDPHWEAAEQGALIVSQVCWY